MRTSDEIVAAARGCVGARFRPHGRRQEFGLDCVGVAGIVFARAVPGDYPLRGGRHGQIAELIDQAGLARIAPDAAGAGTLLLIDAGLGQLHLAVLTDAGFVHADVGLRRVVETPGRPAGIVVAAWKEQG